MKRRVDEFVPEQRTADVELLEQLREAELADFLDNDCCKTSREANRKINGIVKYYNDLLQAVLNGQDIQKIIYKLQNENRKNR